jgi:putative ABC transport system substrate-binding protein
MRRRDFIKVIAGTAAAWPRSAGAQAQVKPFEVGYLYPGPKPAADARVAHVLTGLRSGGLRSDEVTVVLRATGGDGALLAPMAADLAARKVDVIIAVGPAAVRTARAATTTIAIVASDLESDPVASGFVSSYARPGSNITGTFLDFPDFAKKWLEVLKETIPRLAAVAVFWDPSTGAAQIRAIEAAAPSLGISLNVHEVRGGGELDAAFESAKRKQSEALLILSSPFVGANTKLFADLAMKHRLAAITLFPDFARNGGLMAYGPSLPAFYRQQGIITARILRGAKAAEIPIETPTKFEFVLNLNTASKLSVTVPPAILLRADEVIE